VRVRVRVALTHEGEGLLVELHGESDAVLERLRASRTGARSARAPRAARALTLTLTLTPNPNPNPNP